MTMNLISYVGGSQEATWVQLRNEQHSQYQLDYSADNVRCVTTKSNVNSGDPCRNGLNFDNHSALQLVKRDVLCYKLFSCILRIYGQTLTYS